MIPFRVNENQALYMKNPVPAMSLYNFVLADGDMINELFNNSNPLIKYLISSAAGDVNLFFGNKYDNKLEQLYDIFTPRDFKLPSDIIKKRNRALDADGELNFADDLSILFPGIFKSEDMSKERIRKLAAAVRMYEIFIDSMPFHSQANLALQKAFPMMGYTPFKIDII